MSANNVFKELEKKLELTRAIQSNSRKTSIDPFLSCQKNPSETLTSLSKTQKLLAANSYKIPKIEQWESTPSKDGMTINLFLNIKFNLKNIMVNSSPFPAFCTCGFA